jgi:predicted nucleic-acid-binding protein
VIGLDTNVLVRFLAQDDALQSAAANGLFEHRLTETEPGYISTVVLVETAWVLERCYGVRGPDLAGVIERLLQTATLVVEHEQAAFRALTALRAGRGGFADALIVALAAEAGCATTVTFDRAASRLDGATLLY